MRKANEYRNLRKQSRFEFCILDTDGNWCDWMDTSRERIRRMHGDKFVQRLIESTRPYEMSDVDGVSRRWRKKA